jgi:hypothetical protein
VNSFSKRSIERTDATNYLPSPKIMPRLTWYLETKRLKLRAIDSTDARNLYELNADPRVMEFLSPEYDTLEEAEAILPKVVARWGFFGVRLRPKKFDANLFDGSTNPIYVFGLARGVWLDDAGRQSSRIRRVTRLCLL